MPPTDPSKISKVVVHPLVLLSVVDHFNRMGKVGNMKRVVGVLLGANRQGILDVSNSFAGAYHLLVIVHFIDKSGFSYV
jgi:26S proteasome regulatory subunit N8